MAVEEKNETNQTNVVNPTDEQQLQGENSTVAEIKGKTDQPINEHATKSQEKVKQPYMSRQYMVLPVKSYFWTRILFCIPVIGQLSCLIMTLGGSRYRNKVNFARACFIMMILEAAILVGLYFLIQLIGHEIMEGINQFLVNTGVGYPTDLTALDEWVKKIEEVPQVQQYLQDLNQRVFP